MPQVVGPDEKGVGFAGIMEQRRPANQRVGGSCLHHGGGVLPYVEDVPGIVLVKALHALDAGDDVGKLVGEAQQGLPHGFAAKELFQLLAQTFTGNFGKGRGVLAYRRFRVGRYPKPQRRRKAHGAQHAKGVLLQTGVWIVHAADYLVGQIVLPIEWVH